MRLNYLIVLVARNTGWSLEYIGQLPLRKLVGIAGLLDYQRYEEIYRIEYRLAQIMCILTSDKLHHNKPEQFVGQLQELKEVTKIMATEKPSAVEVVLGDGLSYKFPPLTVNMMEAVEEEFDKPWDELLTKPKAKVLKAIVWNILVTNYPNLTRPQVGELLTLKVLDKVTTAIVKMG